MSHKILISVGSNVDKEHNTYSGLQALNCAYGELVISTIFESESVGFKGSNFLNLVVKAQTVDSIASVCKLLKQIEDKHGRVRDKKFANRTLDLDLLTYDQQVCKEPVVLPRAEIEYNAFVLKPMAEIVPNDIHPLTGKTYAQLWQEFSNEQQRLWPSGMQWSNAAT